MLTLNNCINAYILAREVDFSKMKKDSLKISKLRTSGGGGGGGGQGFGTPEDESLKVAKF